MAASKGQVDGDLTPMIPAPGTRGLGRSPRAGATHDAAGDGPEPPGPGEGRGRHMGEADAEGRVDPLISWLPILMQLLWDLELLTGVGLGLFWPPWARVYGQRDQTQHAWNQCNQSWGRNLDGDSKCLVSVVRRGTM